MKDILFFHKYLVGIILVVAALVNGIVRFNGDWGRFFTMLWAHFWFAQAVFNYLRGGWVTIGLGGMGKDAPPASRAGLACFAFFCYLVVFFLSFPSRQ